MSLIQLPNEIIMIIFNHLRDSGYKFEFGTDYWNLASASKRFLYLALNNTGFIEWRYCGLNQHRICDVGISGMKKSPINHRICPAHRSYSSECIYPALDPILSFKHIILGELSLAALKNTSCILATDSSQFEQITDLSIFSHDLDLKSIVGVLLHLRNVVNLTLSDRTYTENLCEPIPIIERSLNRLTLFTEDYTHEGLLQVLMHPNVKLPAKKVVLEVEIHLSSMELHCMYMDVRKGKPDHDNDRQMIYDWATDLAKRGSERMSVTIVEYIKRFKNDVKHLTIPVLHGSFWSRTALEHGLQNLNYKISLDLDTDTSSYLESTIDGWFDRQGSIRQ